MIYRLISLAFGYLLGNVMTAEIVTRRITGRPCRELGTSGNPGMANVMAHLGFKPGLLVLAGDTGKCILACGLSYMFFGAQIGRMAILYAGLGATIGHDFPALVKDCAGGKGVAVSCMAMFLYAPLLGLSANIIGMLVTFWTKYLCIGGAVLPAVFVIFMFLFDSAEAGILSLITALLCFYKHLPAIMSIPSGTCERTDVWGAVRKRIGKRKQDAAGEKDGQK